MNINLVDQYKTNKDNVAKGYTKGMFAPNTRVKQIIVAATA